MRPSQSRFHTFSLTFLAALLCAGSVIGCGRSEDEYQLQVRRAQEFEQQLTDSQRERTALETRLSELETRNSELIDRLAALRSEERRVGKEC